MLVPNNPKRRHVEKVGRVYLDTTASGVRSVGFRNKEKGRKVVPDEA
jgi:hypothetical protein